MKQYFILFLLFLTNTAFAPNFPKEYRVYKKQCQTTINVVKIEQQVDSLDIEATKSLNITKFFSKSNRKQIRHIAKEIGIDQKWLYQIFYLECLYKGDIHTENPKSGAVGLIGFLPSTAKYLGTSSDEIKQMNMSQQLNLTRKYLKIMAKDKKIDNITDLYLLIFRSTAIGKPDNYVIGEKDSKISLQNPIFVNEFGTITKGDIKRYIANL